MLGGAGGVVERKHARHQVATGQLAAQLHPPLRLARAWRRMPVDADRRVIGDEDVGVVRPFVDREVQPVEMRPPERLVLAPVVAARRGDQRDRGLLRCAVADGGIAGERRQGRCQLVVVIDGVRRREPVGRQSV